MQTNLHMIQKHENNCWFNRVSSQTAAGGSIGTQGRDEILTEKDAHCFPAIYRSACIFNHAPPPPETQVSPP